MSGGYILNQTKQCNEVRACNISMSLIVRITPSKRSGCLRHNGSISRMVVADVQAASIRGHTDGDHVSVPDGPFQQFLRQREEHIRSDNSSDRPSTIHIRVPLLRKEFSSGSINIHCYSAILKPLLDIIEAQRHDLQNGLSRKSVKYEHCVQTIEELRRKVLRGSFEDEVFRFFGYSTIVIAG
jgi:hypothetical protein